MRWLPAKNVLSVDCGLAGSSCGLKDWNISQWGSDEEGSGPERITAEVSLMWCHLAAAPYPTNDLSSLDCCLHGIA